MSVVDVDFKGLFLNGTECHCSDCKEFSLAEALKIVTKTVVALNGPNNL